LREFPDPCYRPIAERGRIPAPEVLTIIMSAALHPTPLAVDRAPKSRIVSIDLIRAGIQIFLAQVTERLHSRTVEKRMAAAKRQKIRWLVFILIYYPIERGSRKPGGASIRGIPFLAKDARNVAPGGCLLPPPRVSSFSSMNLFARRALHELLFSY
jgi:hypothetical protein